MGAGRFGCGADDEVGKIGKHILMGQGVHLYTLETGLPGELKEPSNSTYRKVAA